MENADGLSIVIATRGRAPLLSLLLQSIVADMQNCSFPIEAILADASDQAELAAVKKIADQFGARMLNATGNISEARNAGVKRAAFEFILFLDSDVTIRQGTLQAHYEMLQAGSDACVGVVEFAGRSTFAWRAVESMQLMLPFRYPFVCRIVPWGPTANMSFRRSRLLLVHGFDSSLLYGGEDVDLGFRFTDAGFRIATSTAAVAEHTTETWAKWSQNIPRLVRYGRADYYLVRHHPMRTPADVPSQIITIATEIALGIMGCVVYGVWALPRLIALLFAATIAHHVVYAGVKSKSGSSDWAHFAGPVITSLLELGKAFEAIKRGHPSAILRRVNYLDDIVARDWHEIAAGTWGVYASIVVFLVGIILLSRMPR